MQLALIGFSKSGKTTVFNALTGAQAEVSAFASGAAKTHRAVVQVPDERLDKLCALFESKKLVHATVDYLDPVGIRRDMVGQGTSLGDEMLRTIATADAMVAVIRNFDDDSGVDRDPLADYEAIALELVLSDLSKVENRLEKVEAQMQRIGGADRKRLEDEAPVLRRLKETLGAGRSLQTIALTPDEERPLRSFQFLTVKPLLVVVNNGEGDDGEEVLAKLRASAAELAGGETLPDGTPNPAMPHFIPLCGKTEMEIAQLDAAERMLFLEEYGIKEPGAARMIRLSYEALGLISFFTVGPPEAHAWTVRRGSPAVEAAGAIHSDLQRGFIRAQITPWDKLLEAKTFAEAKKRAWLRLEGKEYVMQDGDIVEIMFSV